ncbi:MAG: tetraacyldisaccharide 4'-kinase [Bacteroidales bacterium]|jgi:tetraacyldisaccharide 4'-kinase|nr:tetraacyldisaccharide 4'-kinase [Bacteroidales bacterium]
MTLLRDILLWPAAVIYGSVVALRNILYDLDVLRGHRFPLPVICVGNITAGGTGKTPHVIYIAGKLSEMMDVAVLSRGYLRKSRGFRHVTPESSVTLSGDEPLLMARSLTRASIFVDRDRANGIREILRTTPSAEAVILDDGFQHRAVKAGLNILLTSYNRLMTHDRLLPLGMLRENLRGMSRADIIIVTKAPQDITEEQTDRIRREINPGPRQSLFFTCLAYRKPVPLFNSGQRDITPGTAILLVTGIAEPEPLKSYLMNMSGEVTHLSFPDHHHFSDSDLKRITEAFDLITAKERLIITTEKDGVRLKEITNIADYVRESMYYIPVGVVFIKDEEIFLKKITGYAGKHS